MTIYVHYIPLCLTLDLRFVSMKEMKMKQQIVYVCVLLLTFTQAIF